MKKKYLGIGIGIGLILGIGIGTYATYSLWDFINPYRNVHTKFDKEDWSNELDKQD